jgi:CO dehydrogenase/acetyl-CoA synthase delta subunit
MTLHADLYLDQIDLSWHAGTKMCQVCKVDSLEELLDRLRSGRICAGQCVHWPQHRVEAFLTAIDAGGALPSIPSLDIPRPTDVGLLELNGPNVNSPMLITGNSQLTHEVLLAVLSTTAAPMWMVSVDTGGHTVDMSMVFGTLTPEAIAKAFGTKDSAGHGPQVQELTGRIILPGLGASLAARVSNLLGRPVEVGPICAAELPLFFASDW